MKAVEEYNYADSELAYNRYMAGAYREAIQMMKIAPASHGLDLGCGPGGLFPYFAEIMGKEGSVVAVDGSPHHLQAAQVLIRNEAIPLPIALQQADFRHPLPFSENHFDWLWAADVLWGHLLPEPTALIREIYRVVKPGGTIAIFFGNYDRATFFPGYPRLERLIHLATEKAYHTSRPAPTECMAWMTMPEERVAGWFADMPVANVALSFHPIQYRAPLPPVATTYLHDYLFVEVYQPSVSRFGAEVGMTATEIDLFTALTDPDSALYLLHQPTYYALQWASLTVATVM